MTRLTGTRAVLTISLLLSLAAAATRTRLLADDAPRTIAVTARRFEFEPKQITLHKGETVRLSVTSQDVQHGFFSRPLKIDADLAPGQETQVLLTPQETGTYTIICDHFCGAQHGNMKLTVTVE
ncbi:MAG TPA: cupredoxin domain-containing protein [Thermoanaerobaculia bacterium]|nr:cupredoxin domain-containing protein [Thermoanaerobaculia bacterium]